jgi:hypothetical protein
MKRTSNMDSVPKVLGKIHLGPQTLKITQIIPFRYLNSFQFNLGTKVHFCSLLVPGWGERKKNIVDTNLGHKIVDICVKCLHLMEGSYLMFFYL